jgi:hypothetical protein
MRYVHYWRYALLNGVWRVDAISCTGDAAPGAGGRAAGRAGARADVDTHRV